MKTFKSYVRPDCQFIEWLGFGFYNTRQASNPITNSIPLNGECLDPALDGTLQDNPDCANFGNEQTLARRQQFETRLLEGEASVLATAPKTWVAWLFACLHSTKERLESQINSLLNVLQNLRMDTHQFGMFSFPKSEPFIRVVQRKGFLFLLPGVFASGQRLIEYPPTKFQRPIEFGSLVPGRLEAILECSHHIAHVFYFTAMSCFLQGCEPCIPTAQTGGYTPASSGGYPREFRRLPPRVPGVTALFR